jgi:hypothetical protein
MISGMITWPDIATVDRNVLLIVNSPAGDQQAVSHVLDALEARVPPARVHVIATPAWDRWLKARGWSDARVLFSTDSAGRELEVNYFLESLEALRWIVAKRFAIVLGSAAHNLYNEEVKELFEQRVGIFLGDSVFLAHTLPEPHVFALGLGDLLQRLNRGCKAAQYQAASRALIGDLQALWAERGKPSRDDGRAFDAAAGVLERHLGRDLLSWDERSPIPLHRSDITDTAAEFVRYVESVFHRAAEVSDAQAADLNAVIADVRSRLAQQQEETNRRDRRLAELHKELAHEIDHRDRMLAALNATANELQRTIAQQQEEINRRDRRIVELQEELTREVQIRDRNLVELHEERTAAVNLRDSIIDELRGGRLSDLQREIDRRDRLLGELNRTANELQRALAQQQDETNRRDAIIDDLVRERETLRSQSKQGR